jgi:hypothetical protein
VKRTTRSMGVAELRFSYFKRSLKRGPKLDRQELADYVVALARRWGIPIEGRGSRNAGALRNLHGSG